MFIPCHCYLEQLVLISWVPAVVNSRNQRDPGPVVHKKTLISINIINYYVVTYHVQQCGLVSLVVTDGRSCILQFS